MKIRRTISIDKNDLDLLKPLLESNGDNLSHALRQLINERRQQMNLNKVSGDQQKMMMLRNQIIENRICALVPYPLLQWLLTKNQCVPPLGTFRVILEKYTKLIGIENFTFNDYLKHINAQIGVFGYQYSQRIEVSPDLRNIRITFEGEHPEHLKGTVVNFSCMLSHHPIKLKTKRFIESPNMIIVDYEPCSTEDEAYKSVLDNFGHNQFILDEIQSDINFWRMTANILKADHYDVVIVSRHILIRNSACFK